MAADQAGVTDDHPLLKDPRRHAETPTQYTAVDKENLALELDGTHIQPMLLTMLLTSRQFVRLNSCNAKDMPLIDWNSYATEADHHSMREDLRKVQQMILDTLLNRELLLRSLWPES